MPNTNEIANEFIDRPIDTKSRCGPDEVESRSCLIAAPLGALRV